MIGQQPHVVDTDNDGSFWEYPDLIYEGGLSMGEALKKHHGIETSDWSRASAQLHELLDRRGTPPIPSLQEIRRRQFAFDADAKAFATPPSTRRST